MLIFANGLSFYYLHYVHYGVLFSQLSKAGIKIHSKDNIFTKDKFTKHKQNQCRVIIENRGENYT